jgi:hypothetical protein
VTVAGDSAASLSTKFLVRFDYDLLPVALAESKSQKLVLVRLGFLAFKTSLQIAQLIVDITQRQQHEKRDYRHDASGRLDAQTAPAMPSTPKTNIIFSRIFSSTLYCRVSPTRFY